MDRHLVDDGGGADFELVLADGRTRPVSPAHAVLALPEPTPAATQLSAAGLGFLAARGVPGGYGQLGESLLRDGDQVSVAALPRSPETPVVIRLG